MTDNRHETIHAADNIPIKEAVKEELANAVIAVNGFQRDENYLLQEGDLCTIRLFPRGGDGWGPGTPNHFGDLFLKAVSWVGNLAWAGIKWVGSAIWDSLKDALGAGQQSDLKSPEALKSIPQLRGAKNQSNYNKPIPIVMGKHLYTPMYIGMPYTEIGGEDGEDQYFNALFLLGYGKLQVTDIKLGLLGDLCSNKALKDDGLLVFDGNPAYEEDDPNDDPKLELRQGANAERNDGEVGLYPQKVFEEQLSIELTNFKVDGKTKVLQVPRFTAKNPMKVQVEFTFNGGLLQYDSKGNKQNASVDISIQWKLPQEDDEGWKPFGLVRGGAQKGEDETVTTITRQKSKVMRFIAQREFTYAEACAAIDRTIELRIQRASEQDLESSKISDKVYVTAVRTWCFDYEKSSADNLVPQAPMIAKYRDKTCRLGFRIKASGAVQGTLDALNCVAQSYGRTWDGANWTLNESPAQNPASIALKLLQSPSLGSRAYPDAMLDMHSFGAFYEWCENKGFACNGVLTSKKRADDILDMVLGTGRAMRVLNGNQYGVLIDKPRPVPVAILNSQNVLEASNQKAFADIPSGLCVNFINEEDGYSQNEIYAMYDGSKQPGEGLIETIDMPFVTNYAQAYKNAMYQLACRHLRPEVWIRKLGIFGHLIALGDRVEVQDDTILVGIGEGAAITGLAYDASGNMTGIQTDGLFDVTDTAQRYGITITQYDGVHAPSIRTKEVAAPEAGNYRDFVFAAPIEAGDLVKPSIGDMVSFGLYDRITTSALCFGKKDNGDGTFDLTLAPYQEGVYTADSGAIPEFDSKLTPPQGIPGIPGAPSDTVTREEAIAISKDFAIPGPSGPPATVYELIPGATVIKRNNSGVIDPPTISCEQQSITGNSPPAPSNKTLKYITEQGGEETLYEGPVTVGAWEFIEFRLYDGLTLLDRENVPVLSDGPPATVYHLVPSVPMIARNPSGEASPSAISCAQQVVVGSKPPEPSNKTIKYSTSVNQDETEYTDPVPVAWDWIEFRLRDGETLLDQERVFVLSEGEPARIYELQPSASVIRHYDGVTDPYKIACSQVSITGNGLPVPSNKTLRYATSLDDEQDYEGEIIVNPAWGWIEFRLYDGDVLLDKERVPVLKDGENQIWLDLPNQSISAPCDSDGNPRSLPITTQAILYNGNTPITPGDFYAKTIAARSLVYYPGDSGDLFDPMLGDFYPVETDWWFLSPIQEDAGFIQQTQASIDRNGLITIKQLADDETTIMVNAQYGDAVYSAPLTLIKVKDAQRPVIIDIENENTSIACDAYGDPHPGELPLQTKAVLYWGAELVAPFWSLEGGKGITIDQGGILTVAQDAKLTDVNNVAVKAAFRGKTYVRVFTLTKTRDGESPIYLNLIPDNEVIQCDYLGNPLRGLPLTAQAELFKGTQEITAAMELAEAARVDILHYPGSAGNMFDPMLGDFYPTLGYPVVWSLAGAPDGVTIDGHGLITVSGTAELDDINTITVRAAYHGKTYEAAFGIAKARGGTPGAEGNAANVPKYRGVTNTADTGNTGRVRLTSGGYIAMNDLDWVLFMGTADWTRARLYQWSAETSVWARMEPAQNTLEYMEALRDITEGAPDGIFSTVFCQVLFAQQAAIATLESQLIQVLNAIYGGERFTKDGDTLVDNGADKTGFMLGADGKFIASNGEFSGLLRASSIHIDGNVTVGDTYVLRSNYSLSAPINQSETETYSFMQSVTTMAQGTCRLVMQFGSDSYSSGYSGKYKILLNNIQIANDDFADRVAIDINLPFSDNHIEIWGWTSPAEGRPILGHKTVLKAVELRVAEDPAVLSFMGM
jgi:hypothetical protein